MLPRLVSPESSRAADGDAISSSADFYSKWSYVKPSDILPYLDVSSTPGDVPSIIRGAQQHLCARLHSALPDQITPGSVSCACLHKVVLSAAGRRRSTHLAPRLPPRPTTAMDAFAEKYPMYKLSHEKGELLGKFVREAKPKARRSASSRVPDSLGFTSPRAARLRSPAAPSACSPSFIRSSRSR